MDVQAVREELADILKAIDGLQVFAYEPGSIKPPTAVIGWPERIDFDASMTRGADRADWEIFVFVRKADVAYASENLAPYISGSGPASFKERIEEHTPTRYDSARVRSVEVDGFTYAGAVYLGARFLVDIIGSGEE